jgi:prepilin-type processing-associated H-X9-DG protein
MPESNQRPPYPLDHETPPNRPQSKRNLVLWLFIGFVALLCIGGLWLSPLRFNHPESGLGIKSAANLRSIGQAILMYCNDNNGEYPDSFQTLLISEDITSAIFLSPWTDDTPADGPTAQATADQLTAGGHLSYIYLGRGLNAKTVTPETIVAYEPPPPGHRANALFGDGHVDQIEAADLAKIIARANSGLRPVTMPSP